LANPRHLAGRLVRYPAAPGLRAVTRAPRRALLGRWGMVGRYPWVALGLDFQRAGAPTGDFQLFDLPRTLPGATLRDPCPAFRARRQGHGAAGVPSHGTSLSTPKLPRKRSPLPGDYAAAVRRPCTLAMRGPSSTGRKPVCGLFCRETVTLQSCKPGARTGSDLVRFPGVFGPCTSATRRASESSKKVQLAPPVLRRPHPTRGRHALARA
jgi:hypothetical protein